MPPYLSLLSVADLQAAFARHLRHQRQQLKLSREALSIKSSVPAATIKKFELTGQISLRQLLLLWQSVDLFSFAPCGNCSAPQACASNRPSALRYAAWMFLNEPL